MAEERNIELQYISKEMLDDRLQRIDERYGWDRELTQSNFNAFQASMERNFEIFKNQVNGKIDRPEKRIDALEKKIDGVSAELKQTKTELQGQIKALDKKIDGVKTELTGEIKRVETKVDDLEKAMIVGFANVDKRFDDMDKNQNKWFAIFGIALAFITVAIPLITIVAQKFLQ